MTTDQIGRWGSLSTLIVSLTGGSSRILFGSSSSLDNPIDPSFVNAEKIKSLTFVRHPSFKTPKICFHKLWFHHAPYRRKFLLLLILFWTYLTGEKKFVFLLWILFFSGGWVSVLLLLLLLLFVPHVGLGNNSKVKQELFTLPTTQNVSFYHCFYLKQHILTMAQKYLF